MKIINTQRKLCPSCMEEHDVEVVETDESNVFKGEQVEFTAVYEYCSNAEEYSENEEMIKINDLAFKDAYRRKQSLLTSKEIQAIREKYDISQKEFSEVLGWGMATITRYENHQVQDRAHDDILRKINSDPKWFLEMLERSKDNIAPKKFTYYYKKASEQLEKKINPYARSIYSVENLSFSLENMSRDANMNQSYCKRMSCGNQYKIETFPVQTLIAHAM
ncbi:MAG: type II toxin-antitoxin system MqsA family antitoxin [Carboxydocellales bacterium]